MAQRAGSADLPLHGGYVPKWLSERMARLGPIICEAIIIEYGRDELLRRLAHPFWFQCFGSVMGMDWHSSGITTSVIGALKHGLRPMSRELGLTVCGGRGKHSRKTPDELLAVGSRVGIDGGALAAASRMVAKVDSAAVQDGFELYLHGFIVADDGKWVIVQQGMKGEAKQARRYHWLSEGLESFVDEPHAAIDGRGQGVIVNLTDHRAAGSRRRQVEILSSLGPGGIVKELSRLEPAPQKPVEVETDEPMLPHLVLPDHHDVRREDVVLKRLQGSLAAAAERAPKDFAELLAVPGVGARTVKSLAMVAEVVHGAPYRFSDPARFAFAHGGKDGHPFPVPLKVYDQTIGVLKSAVTKAKLGATEEMAAIRRLDEAARRLEAQTKGPSFGAILAEERAMSPLYGGRTVADDVAEAKGKKRRA